VGTLGVVDFDRVDLSNLQRQILHGTPEIGQPKTVSAQRAVARLNPHTRVVAHPERLTSQNALDVFRSYDLIVDGSDNFPTRYLANDAAVLLQKPYVYGSVYRFEGQASVFAPHLGGPCYRCLFPEPPPPGQAPSCAEGGVLGVLPGIIGCIQAGEALKLILGAGEPLLGRLLLLDALPMKFRELKLRRDPACPLCGENRTIHCLVDYEAFCGALAPSLSSPMNPDEITVQELKNALEQPQLKIRVIDVREPDEYRLAHLAGVDSIPLSVLPQRIGELDPKQTTYLHCKGGVRSLKALKILQEHGFRQVKSVRGGLVAWIKEIDPNFSPRP
jgi:sulfur-carrier protein adenylyltransferase/sulfurtransferase